MTPQQGRQPIRVSLEQQIHEVKSDIARHHTFATAHRQALGQALRSKATSPASLLVAAGAGFLLGQITFSARSADPDAAPPAVRSSGASLHAMLLSALTLAGPILTLLQQVRDRSPPTEAPHEH